MIEQYQFLGRLCERGHEYENTGKTLRYKKSGSCVKCTQENRRKAAAKRKQEAKNTKKRKTEARAYAAIHCIHYAECLDAAAKETWGGIEMECHKCDRMQVRRPLI